MINIIKLLLLNISIFIFGTLLYAGLFRTSIFEDLHVYFYRAVILLCIAVVILTIFLVLLKQCQKFIKIEWKDIIICLTITFCLNFSFLSLITVALDRSISVFILSEMANHNTEVYTKNDIEKVFLDVYMDKYNAMDRRIEEQIISGNIERIGNGYRITEKGCNLIEIFRGIAWLFPIDNRFLYPPK